MSIEFFVKLCSDQDLRVIEIVNRASKNWSTGDVM